MPRKGHIAKRDVLADPIYNNKVVTKLINNIMLDGKKGVAQKIVYGAFDRIAEETGKPALEVFEEAMNNIMPLLEEFFHLTVHLYAFINCIIHSLSSSLRHIARIVRS